MKQNRITTKISRESLRLLRLIAATTGERQYAALQRILDNEWQRVKDQPAASDQPLHAQSAPSSSR